MRKVTAPKWLEEGPMDFEYKSYKMMSNVKELNDKLLEGELEYVLDVVDDTLDYLYAHDAQRMDLLDDMTSQELWDADLENLETAYRTGQSITSENMIDDLVDAAIDQYEVLHSKIRLIWNHIIDNSEISYIMDRPYLINDGFVFMITPNNMMHIYSFNKPAKHMIHEWKGFKLEHISTEKFTKDTLIERVEEIDQKNTGKIMYRVKLKSHTEIDSAVKAVISSQIFTQLRKDYGF